MSNNNSGKNTSKVPSLSRPTGKISQDYLQHSLKPGSTGTKPASKPAPGPKTK